jgi:hypothetical protein
MWNIFNKKEEVLVLERSNIKNYPKEVLEIHYEFETASDKLLESAYEIINSQPMVNISKIEKLKSFGFNQVKEVEESSKVIETTKLSKEQIELVQYFKQNYPFNKFITEEQVQQICHKYNLVCGDVGRFKGFVPENNIKDIENFKIKLQDKCEYLVYGSKGEFYINKSEIRDNIVKYLETTTSTYVEFSNGEINVKGGYKKYGEYAEVKKQESNLQICAPVKDMDISGLELIEGYKLQKKHIPDPVVLQPVKGGYLIITAWGDEASDPLVVNENFN